MLACREIVALEGGYNKKMISYGWEDTEFFKRLNKLGYYSVMLSDYNLIHLDHRRGPDSRINEMYDRNRQEFEKVISMSRRELRKYVENEIDIAEPEEKYRRNALRKRQSIINIFLAQKMYHLVNKIRIYIQLYGFGSLFRRLAQQK
jgi:predicted glycosyltransferase involved in capsule biosynthesis